MENEMTLTLQCWEDIKREVLHYLSQGSDYFEVFSGPWTIEYDNRKESEVK